MAVRRLAGPFKIRTREGEFPPSAVSVKGYYPNVGLMMYWASRGVGPATLDGVQETMFWTGLTGTFGWWPERGRMVRAGFFDEYELDPRTLTHRLINSVPYTFFLVSDYPVLKQRTRWLWVSTGGTVLHARDETTGVDTDYATLPFGAYTMGAGRGIGEVFIGSVNPFDSTAFGYFFNVESKKADPPFYLGVVGQVWYSPEHQVMVSVEGGGLEMSVWSFEVEPSIVTEAVVVRGEARAGCVPTYQVRVTGAQGEPCSEEFVDWTIQGAGRLEHLQSETDKDGYAEVKVIYGLHEEGDSTIRASVRC